MSDNIIQLSEQVIKTELKDLLKQSVEEPLTQHILGTGSYGAQRF